MIYQNFDLEIINPQGGHLCARVLESPQGDCPFIDVKWPFEADEENALLSDIYGGLRQRRARSNQGGTIQDFGGRLFDAVFSGDIEHLFRSSLDTSFRSGKGLRIRLRLPEDSELHARPWEFLFDTENREFLAVREHTPLVRYLPVAQPIPPITVEGPLRILVALASPTDHPRLDVAREWDILCHALEPLITAGQLELRRVPGRCTFDNLRDSLRHFRTHIFHFVGHGLPGALVLEHESGRGMEMEAIHLRSAFPSGALPRLVVLNACSGAIAEDVPFSGLAQGFLKQGVPAVVAMQASITDDAALIFTRYFYRDLVETGAVDASLTEARLRMQGNGHPIEWGTPVLYMRALSGQLFQPAANPTEREKPREIQAKAEAPPPRVEPTLNERKKPKESQAKENIPPLPPGTSPAERKKPRAARPKENAPPVGPKPNPAKQDSPPVTVLAERMPPPALAPEPAPEPIVQVMPPKAPVMEPPTPSKPRLHLHEQPSPPPKVEPHLVEQEIPPDVRAREPAPASKQEPKLDAPGIPRDTGTPSRLPLPQEKPGSGTRFPVVGLAAGLLSAALIIAIGIYKVLPSRSSTALPAPAPAPTSISAAPSATPSKPSPSTTRPVSAPASTVTPSPANPGNEAARIVSGPRAPEVKPKRTTPTPRKDYAVRKPPLAPADNCKSSDVSERSANCLFQ
jgi:hypothetical protein